MPNYNYYCNRCDGNHTVPRKYEERNKSTTCPDCGKRRCPLTYDNSKNKTGGGGVVVFGGGTPNFYGTDSRMAQEKDWMENEVKNTKNALEYKSGASPYSRVKIPYEKLEKEGTLKKASEDNKRLRVKGGQHVVKEAGKKMTKDEVDRAGERGDSD